MSTCPSCEKPVKEGAIFCLSCGAPLRGPKSGATPPPASAGIPRPGSTPPPGSHALGPMASTPPPGSGPFGKPAGVPATGQRVARHPAPSSRMSRGQQQLYTVLGFLFLVLILAFGANKARQYLMHPNTKVVYVPEPGSGGKDANSGGENAELLRQRELEAKRRRDIEEQQRELEHQAELKKLDEEREREQLEAQKKLDEAARENQAKLEAAQRETARLEQERAEAAKQAAVQADEVARIEQQRQQQLRQAQEEAQRKQAELDALNEQKKSIEDTLRKTVPVYNGPNRGEIVWSGALKKGDEIYINGNSVDHGKGMIVSGGLPGIQVQCDVPQQLRDKIQVFAQPNALNGYKELAFRAVKDVPATTITFTWNRP
jgi:hypothetical protein